MKSESKQMHLDDLCHAIREFARGEGLEERGVDEDVLRLVLLWLRLNSGSSQEPTSANMLAELSHIWL